MDAQTDQYLDVLTQLLDKEAPAEMGKFVDLTTRYFNGGVLYKGIHNALRATGGTVSFAYSAIAAPVSNLEFGTPEPAQPVADEIPDAPKPAAKAPAKAPVKKAAPKPAAKKKSDGWDSADMWSSPTGGGWGDDDGWGAPVKKKTAAKTGRQKPGLSPLLARLNRPQPKPPNRRPTLPILARTPGFGAADTGAPTYDAYYPPPTRGGVTLVLKGCRPAHQRRGRQHCAAQSERHGGARQQPPGGYRGAGGLDDKAETRFRPSWGPFRFLT